MLGAEQFHERHMRTNMFDRNLTTVSMNKFVPSESAIASDNAWKS
ncbi:uncharacterized protein RAG0_11501 [Rhynchosporium agropyri]|uniref:Uncharacterized protein n=2 Tax=Rhynchosporium TaxID=38037 RepID=A0A1E1L4S4_9HELO|nr:uncharacterized protein RCO7_05966 [Rhynchosporium commune]CZT05393.1 uncharacterized protein RAG0_11501 [Rhynchosporium agropyri]